VASSSATVAAAFEPVVPAAPGAAVVPVMPFVPVDESGPRSSARILSMAATSVPQLAFARSVEAGVFPFVLAAPPSLPRLAAPLSLPRLAAPPSLPRSSALM
jgi:hypothetical protein